MFQQQMDVSADAVAVLELLAADAPLDHFETLIVRARSAGMDQPLLDRLENARRLGLRIHSQLDRRQQREANLSALVDTARELAAPQDLKCLLKVLARRTRALLGTDLAFVALPDAEGNHIRVEASDGHVSPLTVGLRIPCHAGLSHDVLTASAPAWSADYPSDPRFPPHEQLDRMVRAEEVHGIIAVPLGHDGRPGGVLFAADREPWHFTADEVSLASSLGDLAGPAIERAQLLDRTLAEMEALRQDAVEAKAQHRRWAECEDAHERLMDRILSGCSLQSLAEDAAARLAGALTVYASDGTVLASTASTTVDDRDVASLAMMDAHAAGKPVRIREGLWAAPVVVGEEPFATLLLHRSLPPARHDERLLRLVAQDTAVLLLQNSQGVLRGSQAREGFLDDLINSTRSDRELERRARKLGVDLAEQHVVVVARPVGEAQRKAAVWASSYAHRKGGMKSEQPGLLVFLLPGDDAAQLAREAHNDLSPPLQHLMTVSAAGPVSGLRSIRRIYHEALRCLEVMNALGLVGRSAAAPELGFLGLLLSEGHHHVSGFIDSVIGPVISYDRQRLSQLTPTLEVYFSKGRSPTHAAKELHVHPNTVARRLERVGELLGDDWQQPDRSLDVQLALKLRRIRAALSEARQSEGDPPPPRRPAG